MPEPEDNTNSAAIAWKHTAATMAVAIAVLGTCAVIDGAAHSERLAHWVQSQRLATWKQTNSTYQHALGFVDFENRLLIDEIPKADYSRGGVYFIGSSTTVMSVKTWELPPWQRSLIGNYGVSGATHRQQFHFVRYLIEHEGLLGAGGEKTRIVLGLFYGSAADTEGRPNGQYFPELFRAHGLHTYSARHGIRPAAISPLHRLLRREKARCSNFLRRSVHNAGLGGGLYLGVRGDLGPASNYSNLRRKQFWQDTMGQDWESAMADQTAELARLIDYLDDHKVRVTAVLMPLGSWHHDLPYPAAYRKQVEAICNARTVPLVDLSGLLSDDQFSDSCHFNYSGQRQLHPVLLELALSQLRETGALPAVGYAPICRATGRVGR